jgi:hypothetical protein
MLASKAEKRPIAAADEMDTSCYMCKLICDTGFDVNTAPFSVVLRLLAEG